MLKARERRGERFAQAEDAFEGCIGGGEGVEREFKALEAEDGAAVAFDDGGNAVPIGAAEVATDDEAFGFDALHGKGKHRGESSADTGEVKEMGASIGDRPLTPPSPPNTGARGKSEKHCRHGGGTQSRI